MKCFGIASPKIAMSTLTFLVLFVSSEIGILFFADESCWILCLLPVVFLILFLADITIRRKAFGIYKMDESGVRNSCTFISWDSLSHVELVRTEVSSRICRGRTIRQYHVCVGVVASGDLFNQDSTVCVCFPLTIKNISRLQRLGGGKSSVLDSFLAGYTETNI